MTPLQEQILYALAVLFIIAVLAETLAGWLS